jgi:urease accessory protein
MKRSFQRLSLGLLALGAAGTAAAHPGHEATSFMAGLAHPLWGADHLLAMLAVGLWSVAALPARQRLMGPLGFMAALALGAVAGSAGLHLGWLEAGVAVSLLVMAALLASAAPTKVHVSPTAGLALVAVTGLLHGLAHGSEAPASGLLGAYLAGMLATSGLLHGLGLALGQRLMSLKPWVWRLAAGGVGAAGALLLARV